MKQAKCNLFKNSFSPGCEYEVSILQVLRGIRDGKWKGQVLNIRKRETKKERGDLKKWLPCVTFSGTFNESRSEKNIKHYSRLMVIDIDGIKKHERNRFKRQLKEDPFIISFFESPSQGLKALVSVNSPIERHKSEAFPYVQEYFKEMHGITIDKSGKDICRLCYVSYDPELYYTDLFTTFEIPANFKSRDKIEAERKFQSLRNSNKLTESNDAKYVFELCKKWVREGSIGPCRPGNKNNHVHALACCLNRAGMDRSMAEIMILSNYTSLNQKEALKAIGSAYTLNAYEFGKRPILTKSSNQQSIF